MNFKKLARTGARRTACLAGLALMVTACQPASNSELDARFLQSIATEAGKNYAKQAILAFWGDDIARIWQCLPSNEPLTVYIEIKPDGKMGEFVTLPETSSGACIAKQTQGRVFPKPPTAVPYVIKITLKHET